MKNLAKLLAIFLMGGMAFPVPGVHANGTNWEASLAFGKPVKAMQGSLHSSGTMEGLVDGKTAGAKETFWRMNTNAMDGDRWTWAEVDLEALQEVGYFKLYTHKLYNASPDSYISTIRIEGSSDGSGYTMIIPDSSPENQNAFPYETVLTFAAEQPVNVRYVRLWLKIADQAGEQAMVPALREFGVFAGEPPRDGGSSGYSAEAAEALAAESMAGASRGTATVEAYPLSSFYARSAAFALTVDGVSVPVVRYDNNDREEYHYAHFSFSGDAAVQITANQEISSYRIRPESYGIAGVVSGRTLSFELSESRYLLININSMQNLVILADALEKDVPALSGEGIYAIGSAPYPADNSGEENVTDSIQKAIDDANAAGGGTVYVPAGDYKISSVTMKGNVSLYLAGGAVVRGTGDASDYQKENSGSQSITTFIKFRPNDTNMKIWGRGTLDTNGERMYDMSGGRDPQALRICGVRPNNNSHVIFDGIIISHATTWTVVPQLSDNIIITNTKVLNSEHRGENDGVDINSCQDVLVYHCFTYTNDDSVCVKACNSGSFKGMIQGADEDVFNVTFDDIVTYGRCAGTKVGMQGFTRTYNVWFKNIEVLQGSRGIAIQHDQGRELVEGIYFENINVEDLVYRVYKPYPMQFRITAGGRVDGISLTNVHFKSFGDGDAPDGFNDAYSVITGLGENAMIKNMTFTNLTIAGKQITHKEAGRFNINEYTSGITFHTGEVPAGSASFTDLEEVLWAKQYIELLAAQGLIGGIGDGLFAPDRPVNRQEFSKMIVDAFGIRDDSAETDLSDVDPSAWYYPYVAAAERAGIVKGIGDNRFGIDSNITHQDMAVMAHRALDTDALSLRRIAGTAAFEGLSEVSDYAREAVNAMNGTRMISEHGQNRFVPRQHATRAQAAAFIGKLYAYRTYYRQTETEEIAVDTTQVSALMINAGGEEVYTDSGGNEYVTDRFYSDNSTPRSISSEIAETEDGILYQSYRFSADLIYTIPVEPGTYDVTLKMMEPFFSENGRRVFDIQIQGQTVLSDLDLFKEAGRHTAFDRSFTAGISGGELEIRLTAAENNAIVSAIEIVRQ